MTNIKNARLAGAVYLIVAVCGMFAELFVNSRLIISGDAATTIANITANTWLFRVGIAANIISHIGFLLFAWLLYEIFKPTNKRLSKLFVLTVVVSTTILCFNMVNQLAAFLLLDAPSYLTSAFSTAQLQALAVFFLDLYKYGYLMAQLFFGGYMFPLGYLVYKSNLLPKTLSVLLIIAAAADVLDVFVNVLFPKIAAVTSPYILMLTLGEVIFGLWLLTKGVKEENKK